jgi:hypothetical protein
MEPEKWVPNEKLAPSDPKIDTGVFAPDWLET